MDDSLEIYKLTYVEVLKKMDEGFNRLILPVGTIEAHGPHLPLGTDVIIPTYLAKKLAPHIKALIAPPIYYGVTSSLLVYAGTSTISEETLKRLIEEIIRSYMRHGFKTFIVLNGHGGNSSAIKSVLRKLWENKKIKSILIDWWIFAKSLTKEIFGEIGAHGGVDETAVVFASHPELVKKEFYRGEDEVFLYREGLTVYPSPGSIIIYEKKSGLPKFDRELANRYVGELVEFLKNEILKILEKIENV